MVHDCRVVQLLANLRALPPALHVVVAARDVVDELRRLDKPARCADVGFLETRLILVEVVVLIQWPAGEVGIEAYLQQGLRNGRGKVHKWIAIVAGEVKGQKVGSLCKNFQGRVLTALAFHHRRHGLTKAVENTELLSQRYHRKLLSTRYPHHKVVPALPRR